VYDPRTLSACRLEELLQQKEKVLQEMTRREARYEEEFRVLRSRMDVEHSRSISELETRISTITMEAQSDKQVWMSIIAISSC
jgi:flagellar biosynthesis/type III secretory pathway chaperone